jgi:hypothetical protein
VRIAQGAALAFAAVGGLLAGGAISHFAPRTEAPSHVQSRTKAILSQAAQRDYSAVVIGDSIVELAALPNLCGQQTLNAGLSGMPVEKIDELAKPLFGGRKLKLVVIAAGINDAHKTDPEDSSTFAPAYSDIIKRARATGARVVALDIEPVGNGTFQSAALFDIGRIQRLNHTILGLHVPVVDLWPAMAAPGRTVLKDGFTDDGVHPNARGYRAWDTALLKVCGAKA